MQLRKTISAQYDTISWVFRIFLGGAVNIVFLNALSVFVGLHVRYFPSGPNGPYYLYDFLTPSILPQFLILMAMVFLSPFVGSLILTKRSPDLKIVPPVYIAMIGWVYLLIFQIFPLEFGRDFIVVMFGVLIVVMGSIEDKAVTSILGVATERESIYFEYLTVFADIDEVKSKVETTAKTTKSFREIES